MKKIDRHNYMAFFVDYFDNELNENEVKLLFDFLDANPDLKDEFNEFENFTLQEQETSFENKVSLKRHIDKNNIEDYIIADLEGILDISDKKEYTDFIAENGLYATTIERYNRTILPNENFIFPDKNKLKRKNKLILLWPTLSAVAATLVIFILLNKEPESNYQFQALELIKKQNTDLDDKNEEFYFIKQTFEATQNNIAKTEDTPSLNAINKKKNNNSSFKKIKKENEIKNIDQKEKQPINSSIIENQIEKQLIAEHKTVEEPPKTYVNNNSEQIPTIKQAIHNSIKDKVFRDNNSKNKLIDKEYLIAATTERLNNSKNIAFKQSQQKTRKKTRLKIGKFEFYRDKKA